MPTPLKVAEKAIPRSSSSSTAIRAELANELIFAVVGHVGSGPSTIARALQNRLEASGYSTEVVKASDVINNWSARNAKALTRPIGKPTIEHNTKLQDLGDEMRKSGDFAMVAKLMVAKIREVRANKLGLELKNEPIVPDGEKRAFILDALRHPAEVHILRSIYRSAFTLIGVVAESEVRLVRLADKFADGGKANAQNFMDRDSQAGEDHGQRVTDAFHLSDFFIDNSADRFMTNEKGNKESNPNWQVTEDIKRLVDIITHERIIRPTSSETAMHAAFGAKMRSGCLSRQVGAAIMDNKGQLLATGANDVPAAGGGLYGEAGHTLDDRCFVKNKYCSNNTEQTAIIEETLNAIVAALSLKAEDSATVREILADSRITALIEFSRAVHAEMDALLSAGRKGKSTVGSSLFVTTFPCHYCARHLVSAGVDEVHFIEPYPKSKALDLHGDSIRWDELGREKPPSLGGTKVLFRSFVGVAPRMYKNAFLKDRSLKNKAGKLKIGEPEWIAEWDRERISYPEMELKVTGGVG